jgi:hypothetical protein
LWWYGPEWLSNTELWPKDIVTEPTPESNAEAKAVKQIFTVAVDEGSDIDKVLQKAVRICAWIYIYIYVSEDH